MRLGLRRFASDGAVLDTLPHEPLAVMGLVPVALGGRSLLRRVFGAETQVAESPDGYWVGTARGYELRHHDKGGRLQRVVRWQGPDLRVTPETVSEMRRTWDATSVRFEDFEVSDSFPAYDALHADRSGGVWVRAYLRPGESGPASWWVVDGAGRLGARIVVPDGLSLREIGADRVLAVHTDELGVERLHGLGLVRR